jgi:hypothetical protein
MSKINYLTYEYMYLILLHNNSCLYEWRNKTNKVSFDKYWESNYLIPLSIFFDATCRFQKRCNIFQGQEMISLSWELNWILKYITNSCCYVVILDTCIHKSDNLFYSYSSIDRPPIENTSTCMYKFKKPTHLIDKKPVFYLYTCQNPTLIW